MLPLPRTNLSRDSPSGFAQNDPSARIAANADASKAINDDDRVPLAASQILTVLS